jgi:hypothetical protein
MVGIRSHDGLVVGSCTSHPGVLGSIPKREEPGKTGAPCIKVPGSSRVPAPPWVGSRSPDGWDQIPRWAGGWVLHQPPWSFPVLKYRVPHGSQSRPGWDPDSLMVGIRSPDGLVVGSCTSHPGVLCSIPKREESGKTGAPCIKVPGSSRVPEDTKLPLWRGAGGCCVLAGTRRPSAAGEGVPPSLQILPHTHILLARSLAPYSSFRWRAHSPTAFSGPVVRPPPSPPRPPPSHMHAGWMVSATKTPASSATSQDSPFQLYM